MRLVYRNPLFRHRFNLLCWFKKLKKKEYKISIFLTWYKWDRWGGMGKDGDKKMQHIYATFNYVVSNDFWVPYAQALDLES